MDLTQTRSEHDCLYGEIRLPVILWKIIDTREFQRLRYIKQLGGVDYVFKDATHTRYQHSIGTAYLAGLIAWQLRQQFENINDQDIGCVQIAALCHDLGHGPFSFIFRKKVLPQLGIYSLEHKDLAYEIFKKIWMNVVIMDPKMKDVLSPKDMLFIKELIRGTSKKHSTAYEGRDVSKICLYMIFSNKNMECDMCKFDYMARDCLQFGILEAQLFVDLKSFGTVDLVWIDGNMQVHPRPALRTNLTKFRKLHIEAYQNPSVTAVEHMICDAILRADELLRISSCLSDLDIFCGLDDRILWTIKNCISGSDPKLEDAKRILERLDNGQYYTLAMQWKIKQSVCQNITVRLAAMNPTISPQMIRVSVLSKKATTGYISEDERVLQVFSADPYGTFAVRCACEKFKDSLPKQEQPTEI